MFTKKSMDALNQRTFDEVLVLVEQRADEIQEADSPSSFSPSLLELRGLIDGLETQERVELLALVWIGRNDFSVFIEARDRAQQLSKMKTGLHPSYITGKLTSAHYLTHGREVASNQGFRLVVTESDQAAASN